MPRLSCASSASTKVRALCHRQPPAAADPATDSDAGAAGDWVDLSIQYAFYHAWVRAVTLEYMQCRKTGQPSERLLHLANYGPANIGRSAPMELVAHMYRLRSDLINWVIDQNYLAETRRDVRRMVQIIKSCIPAAPARKTSS